MLIVIFSQILDPVRPSNTESLASNKFTKHSTHRHGDVELRFASHAGDRGSISGRDRPKL